MGGIHTLDDLIARWREFVDPRSPAGPKDFTEWVRSLPDEDYWKLVDVVVHGSAGRDPR